MEESNKNIFEENKIYINKNTSSEEEGINEMSNPKNATNKSSTRGLQQQLPVLKIDNHEDEFDDQRTENICSNKNNSSNILPEKQANKNEFNFDLGVSISSQVF